MKNTIKNLLALLLSIIISFIFIYLFIFFGGSKLFESGDVILKELGVSIIIGTLVFWIIKINKTSYEKIEELEKRVDSSQYDSFHARFYGRVSELLLDIWIDTNKLAYIEIPVMSMEKVNWLKKGGSFLLAKFAGKKYGKSF